MSVWGAIRRRRRAQQGIGAILVIVLIAAVAHWWTKPEKWSRRSGFQIHRVNPKGDIAALAISPDNRWLACSDATGVYVREVDGRGAPKQLDGSGSFGSGIGFTTNGRLWATENSSGHRRLALWDVGSWIGPKVRDCLLPHWEARPTPDGRRLQLAVTSWRELAGRRIVDPPPDADFWLEVNADRFRRGFRNAALGPNPPQFVRVSADGSTLIASLGGRNAPKPTQDTLPVTIRDAATREVLVSTVGHLVAYSPDSQTALIGISRGPSTPMQYQLINLARRQNLPLPVDGRGAGYAFSPDSKLLAVSYEMIRHSFGGWELSLAARRIIPFQRLGPAYRSCFVSHVVVYEVATGRPITHLEWENLTNVCSRFSKDGSLLAVAGTIWIPTRRTGNFQVDLIEVSRRWRPATAGRRSGVSPTPRTAYNEANPKGIGP